jgi:hypothetical protein
MSGFDETERLKAAWSGLAASWATAREHWNDPIADSFERNVWHNWEDHMSQLLGSLANLDEILNDAIERTD